MFGYVDRVPMKGLRKITAERMRQAVSNAALVTHQDHVDVTELNKVKKAEKEKAEKIYANFTEVGNALNTFKSLIEQKKSKEDIMYKLSSEFSFVKEVDLKTKEMIIEFN